MWRVLQFVDRAVSWSNTVEGSLAESQFKMSIPYWLDILEEHLNIYPETWMRKFFITWNNNKLSQPKCPSVTKWIIKMIINNVKFKGIN